MAELRGWDRDRFRTAPPADVAAARVIAYARRWVPLLQRDIPSELEDLRIADQAEKNPRAAAAHEHKRRLMAMEDLKVMARMQAEIREALGLEARADG